MRSGGSHAKGASFERKVCQRLSRWVSGGTHDDLFWRSAMSGGRATVGARAGKDLRRQAGDITAVAPEGHSLTDRFYIECKAYSSLKLDGFFIRQAGRLAVFWQIAVDEAVRYQKTPLLIAKQNQLPWLVLLPLGDYDRLVKPVVPIDRITVIRTQRHTQSCEVFLFEQLLMLPYREK